MVNSLHWSRQRKQGRSTSFSKAKYFLLSMLLASGGNLSLVLPLLAATPAGTQIRNTATGSFEDPNNLGDVYEIDSNEVVVTVTEVAGITAVPSGVTEAPSGVDGAGGSQGNNSIDADDVVYFEYTITNVGNDPTQFFIPGVPSDVSGGSFDSSLYGPIEIIGYDPDGTSGATAPTDLSGAPIAIPSGGLFTGDNTDGLGLPNGSFAPNGTVTVRIPIKVSSSATSGDSVSVTLGDTGSNDNAAGTQNQPYDATDGNNSGNDLYTHDNDDNSVTNEATGQPANGDAANRRQEASATSTTLVGGNYAIRGNVFEDDGGAVTGNDILDGSDTGISNITVSLFQDTDNDGVGDVLVSTPISTDGLGNYEFTNLPDGNYVVVVDETDTDLGTLSYGGGNADTTQVNPRQVTINSADEEDINFPFDAATASLTGFVWEDIDGDGFAEAGEAPVPYTQVNLYSTNGTPADPSDDVLVGSTFTDTAGTYRFDNLDPEKYYVDFVEPAVGYSFTRQDAGGDDFIDSDADPFTGETSKFDIASEEAKSGVDAGLVSTPGTFVMCEVVSPLQSMNWSRSVNIPKFDPALGDLTNVAIKLDSHIATAVEYENTASNENNITVDPNSSISTVLPDTSTLSNTNHSNATIFRIPAYDGTTDSNGTSGGITTLHHVDSVSVVNYSAPSDFLASAAGASETVDLTVNANSGVASISATDTEQTNVTGYAGQMSVCVTYTFTTYELSGNVFEDYNSGTVSSDGNDVLNNNEAGIKFVTVNLYRDDGDGVFNSANDTLIDTVETDGNGDYLFTGVVNGPLWVRVDTTDSDLGVRGYGGGNVDSTQRNPRPVVIASASQSNINFPFDEEVRDPNVLLVKRITAINGETNATPPIDLARYIDSGSDPYDDNVITVAEPVNPGDPPQDTDQWPDPDTYLVGGIDGGNVLPSDEIEYTIYFLSSGQSTAENVMFCDYVPIYTSFIAASFNGNSQASGGIGGADLGVEIRRNGSFEYHTAANDGDAAVYFPPGIDPATDPRFANIDCDGDGNSTNSNPNGAIVVNLGNITNASSVTTDVLTEAYGYVRFRAIVK